MNPEVYVMAIDIEMSGATLRDSQENCTRVPEGDLIGIGARVLRWNETTQELEIPTDLEGTAGSFFRPMFRPFNKHCSLGTLYTKGTTVMTCSIEEKYKETEQELEEETTEKIMSYPSPRAECTVFEERCWDGFWCKEIDALNQLEYKGPHSKRVMEEYAISSLFKFRRAFEERAHSEGTKLVVVSDNVSFDIGTLDQLLRKYFPDTRPSVYCADDNKKYNGGTPCTHSMQKGLLASVDPVWAITKNKSWGSGWSEWLTARGCARQYWSSTLRIQYLYDIPKSEIVHDHHPLNDADTIAREYWVILLIAKGYYTLHEDRVMKKRGLEDERKKPTSKKSKV